MIQPPDEYAQRAASLLEAHPWMDHPTALTIAQNTGTDQQAAQQAAQTQQAVQQSWNGYEQAYFDPVLQTQPSNALAVAQYLHDTLGPPPVAGGTNLAVQQALVKAGLLDSSLANGSWTPESERAYMQAVSNYKQDQLAGGHKPLSSKVSGFLGGLFHDVKHPWDAIVGWGDSAREAVGYFGGWVGTGFGTLGTAHTQDQFAANIVNTLGGHSNAQQQAKEYANPLNAVGNAFALGGVASVAKGVGKAAVEQAAKGALESSAKTAAAQGLSDETQAELDRAVKVGQAISAANRMGFVQRSINDVAQAFRDGTLPADAPQVQRNLGYITKTFLRAPAKLTSAQWAKNVPGLARMTPAAEWLAGKEGAVLKARNLMAYPYRFAPVRAAGIANQRLQIATLGAHALAGALPGTSFQHNIDSSTSLDAWISNLDHWEQRTFGMSVDPTDLLLGPLHGDLVGAGRASRVIGATVDHYTNRLADGLGRLGIPAAFQTATGLSRQEMLDQFGGDETAMHLWMHSRTADYAGDAYVERQLNKGVTLPDSGEEDQVRALKNQWHALPAAQQRQFMQEMLQADPHMQWLSNRVSNDILRNATSVAAKKQAIADDVTQWTTGLHTMQQFHRDGVLNYVMGPRGHALLAKDAGSRSFGGDLEEPPTQQPSMTRGEYVSTGHKYAKQLRAGVKELKQTSYENLAKAQRKLDEARTPAAKRGAQASLRHAQVRHENALASIGELPAAAIRRAENDLTQARQTLAEAQGSGSEQQVAAAETNMRAAEERLARLKASGANFNLRDLVTHAVGDPDQGKGRQKLEALQGLHRALVGHVAGGVLPEDLQQEVRNAVHGRARFDELYTHQYGPPQALPGDWGSAAHMAQLNKELPGAIGIARVATKTRDEVQDDVRAFGQRAKDIASIADRTQAVAALDKLTEDLRAYLHQHFNMDASKLGVFRDPGALITQIEERANSLASNVLPTWDQPEWVKARLDELRKQGYKLVVGSHIGHVYDGTLPDLGDVWQWKTRLRTWAGKAGLDPQRVPDVEVSRATNASIAGRVHHFLTTDPQAAAALGRTPYADYRTVLAVLQHGVAPELPAWARGVFNFFSKRGMNRTEIQRLADTDFEGDLGSARAEMEKRMAAQIGLRDLPDDVARKALMTPANVDVGGRTFQWGGVDEHTANGILRAVKEGYRLPGYIMGWQAIENWARAPFGFAGGTMGKVMRPVQPLYNRVGNWSNRLVQLRNTLRFTASPLFDARRLAKQNYKMSLELGRPVTVWNPLQDLIDNGELDDATKLWSKVSGAKPDTQMDADRYLLARSIFGLYSPQWHAAWFVNELRKTGKSPDEIKQAYERVFKYGAQGGRTSAERSVNTIFFPFSFEKNLLRNTGAYLADRPGQALALDLAVENWRQIDSNGQVGQWVQAHAPILAELNKLNGFAHGISPGQFGGINAGSLPALNLFLPQHWGSEFTAKNLAKYLPVWKDFAQLVTATHEQLDIVNNAAYDTINKLSGGHNLNRPTLTPQAQITDALNTKAKWVTALQPVLDYNAARASDADKISWPDQAQYGVLQGKPVDKTTIGEYMQMLYPAYNPDAGAAVAQNNARAADAFIAKVKAKDPQKAAQLAAFKQAADKVIGHINRDDYTPQVQAAAQTQFQQYAEHAAQQDPDWLKFYSKFYAWALGQIISPTGKASST